MTDYVFFQEGVNQNQMAMPHATVPSLQQGSLLGCVQVSTEHPWSRWLNNKSPSYPRSSSVESLCSSRRTLQNPICVCGSPHPREVAMSLYLPHSLSYEASSVWFFPNPLTLLPLVGSLIPSWLSPLGHRRASSQSTE